MALRAPAPWHPSACLIDWTIEHKSNTSGARAMAGRTAHKEPCMELAWLDAWLCDLKAAVERSILARRPDIKPDRLARLSAVDYVQDGKYHWVMIAGQIRFAARDED